MGLPVKAGPNIELAALLQGIVGGESVFGLAGLTAAVRRCGKRREISPHSSWEHLT